MSDGGLCFKDAVEIASQVHPNAVVVHGTPIGTGDLNRGRRYWHAWVEHGEHAYVRTPKGTAGIIEIPLAEFYAAGQIDPATCRRFSLTQARTQMMVRGHWGPWVSDEEARSAL